MDGKTFKKLVVEGLNKLTDEDIARIRSEMDLKHDYEIDEQGRTYLVDKNIDTSHTEKHGVPIDKEKFKHDRKVEHNSAEAFKFIYDNIDLLRIFFYSMMDSNIGLKQLQYTDNGMSYLLKAEIIYQIDYYKRDELEFIITADRDKTISWDKVRDMINNNTDIGLPVSYDDVLELGINNDLKGGLFLFNDTQYSALKLDYDSFLKKLSSVTWIKKSINKWKKEIDGCQIADIDLCKVIENELLAYIVEHYDLRSQEVYLDDVSKYGYGEDFFSDYDLISAYGAYSALKHGGINNKDFAYAIKNYFKLNVKILSDK